MNIISQTHILSLHLPFLALLSSLSPSSHISPTEEGYEQFRVAEKSHGNWVKLVVEGNTSEVLTNMGKKVFKQYLEALRAMSEALSKQLGKYDIYSMVVGMVLVFQVGIGVLPLDACQFVIFLTNC
jgi:ethanolaminephosphotransferase